MGALVAVLGIALATPLIALLGAGLRAVILFWPVMLLVGALHNAPGWDWVPAVGWWESMLIVGIVGLLIPSASNANSSND